MSSARHVAQGHDLVRNVLVVDSPQNAERVRGLLEPMGWTVHFANSTGEARYTVRKHEIDFVLTELILPRETGFELCSYLKQHEEHVPILVLTEVALETARNLAIWSGADGYLLKPVRAEALYGRILDVALATYRRRLEAQQGLQGSVDFQCRCGQSLKISAMNAGRATVCPKCGNLARSPSSSQTTSGGVWKLFAAERKKFSQEGRVGFHCDRCGTPVHLFQATGDDGCTNCGRRMKIPKWLRSHARLFFEDESHSADASREEIAFEPLRFLVVRCESCQTYYRFHPESDDHIDRCRHCGRRQTSPSLRGAPLSRAALIATGRFFEHASGTCRGQKFLLHRRGRILIGRDERCHIRLETFGVRPMHGQLLCGDAGPLLQPLDAEGHTTVNDEPVTGLRPLRPGDVLRLGDHRIRLLGNRSLSEQVLVQTVVKKRQSMHGVASFEGATDVAEQAAYVIQLHWERQRERCRAAGRPEPMRSTQSGTQRVLSHPQYGSPPDSPMASFVSGPHQQPIALQRQSVVSQQTPSPPTEPPPPGPPPPLTPRVPPVASSHGSGTARLPLRLPDPSEVGPREDAPRSSGSRFRRVDDTTDVVNTAKDVLDQMRGKSDRQQQ